jgi:hypothetical protein
MDKQTKKILIIVGIGVGAYLLFKMMKKKNEDTSTQRDSSILMDNKDVPEMFNAREYAINQFGVDESKAEEIVSKANYILNHPDGDWYKHTVKRASEEGRGIPQQAVHESWWVINKPNRRLEYIENTWKLNETQANEIIEYIENTILPSDKWVSDTEQRAKERGRSIENQYAHEAVYQLYTKEDAKYKGTI